MHYLLLFYLADERAWLHVKVSPKGFATDIHLVGNAEQWSEKLQLALLNWDHDIDIVENITAVFGKYYKYILLKHFLYGVH